MKERYAAFHPGWPVLVGSCEGEWSKGAAVADGLRQTVTPIVVVADADSFVQASILRRAVRLATAASWVMPHGAGRVYRLSPLATSMLLQSVPCDVPHRPAMGRKHASPSGGGIVVARREVFEAVPLDPGFVGWGGDDISWARALDTLIGPCVALAGDLWHLHHEPSPTRRNALPATEALAGRYLAANGDPVAMARLVHG